LTYKISIDGTINTDM